MANLKSSKKDVRRTATRTAANISRMSEIETAIRAVRSAGDAAAASVALRKASSLLDRAAAKDLLHRRTAARQKSRLSAAVARKFPPAKK